MTYSDLILSGKMNKAQIELLFRNLLLLNLCDEDGEYYSVNDVCDSEELSTMLHNQAEAFMEEKVSEDFLLYGTYDENVMH